VRVYVVENTGYMQIATEGVEPLGLGTQRGRASSRFAPRIASGQQHCVSSEKSRFSELITQDMPFQGTHIAINPDSILNE